MEKMSKYDKLEWFPFEGNIDKEEKQKFFIIKKYKALLKIMSKFVIYVYRNDFGELLNDSYFQTSLTLPLRIHWMGSMQLILMQKLRLILPYDN